MWRKALYTFARSKICSPPLQPSSSLLRGFRLQNGAYSSDQKMAHWGYKSPAVLPEKWGNLFPNGKGRNQSPINISKDQCAGEQTSTSELVLKYNPSDFTKVTNNGHSVTFVAEGQNSMLVGGPRGHNYRLLQFHFHWGSNDGCGSEHTLNGKQFGAEIHLVHLNTKYPTFEEALNHPDGLCVIGAFLEAEEEEGEGCEAYGRIAELIQEVRYNGQTHTFSGGIDARRLLPEELSQFTTYNGSLTTPPLSECVEWVNLLESVKVSKKHLAAFRKLSSKPADHPEEPIVDNFRPVQELHGRRVCKRD